MEHADSRRVESWRNLTASLLLVLVTAISHSSFAQGITWIQTNGPFGGAVWVLTSDSKGNMFAGTRSGTIFRLSKNKERWAPVFLGASRNDITSLVSHGDGKLFFAAVNDGVFVGELKTNTWKRLTTGLEKTDLVVLARARNGTVFAGTTSALFRFDHVSEKWIKIQEVSQPIIGLKIHHDRIYAVGSGSRIYTSSNAGREWTTFDAPGSGHVRSLALASDILYVGTTQGEVYERADKDWKLKASFPGNAVGSLELDDLGNLYAGLGGPAFSSEGGGLYLVPVDGSKPRLIFEDNTNGIAALLLQRSELIVGTNEGVWHSIDRGSNWKRLNSGLIAQRINDIVIDRNDRVYVGSYGGVFTSDDYGRTWTERNNGLRKDIGILDMQINSHGHLFFGTYLSSIYRSTDSGRSWTKLETSIPPTSGNWIMSIAVNSRNHLFTGVQNAGLYRSLDNGDSWQRVGLGVITGECCALVVDSKDRVYAANFKGDLYRSTDDGTAWQKLHASNSPNDAPAQLVIDRYDRVYFGGSRKGVFEYSEESQIWEAVNDGLANITVRSLLFINELFLVGTSGTNDYQNFDGNDLFMKSPGSRWSLSNKGLNHPRVKALAVNSKGVVFAGTWGGGVYRTESPVR